MTGAESKATVATGNRPAMLQANYGGLMSDMGAIASL